MASKPLDPDPKAAAHRAGWAVVREVGGDQRAGVPNRGSCTSTQARTLPHTLHPTTHAATQTPSVPQSLNPSHTRSIPLTHAHTLSRLFGVRQAAVRHDLGAVGRVGAAGAPGDGGAAHLLDGHHARQRPQVGVAAWWGWGWGWGWGW